MLWSKKEGKKKGKKRKSVGFKKKSVRFLTFRFGFRVKTEPAALLIYIDFYSMFLFFIFCWKQLQ